MGVEFIKIIFSYFKLDDKYLSSSFFSLFLNFYKLTNSRENNTIIQTTL